MLKATFAIATIPQGLYFPAAPHPKTFISGLNVFSALGPFLPPYAYATIATRFLVTTFTQQVKKWKVQANVCALQPYINLSKASLQA